MSVDVAASPRERIARAASSSGGTPWRVREAALRVIARRRLDDDAQRVADLRDDPVPRVRSAAERALLQLESH